VPLPADAAGRITDVTWDDSCAVGHDDARNVLQVENVAGAPTCKIVVSLDDDSALSAVAGFDRFLAGACANYYIANDPLLASPFMPLDGGAPACSR